MTRHEARDAYHRKGKTMTETATLERISADGTHEEFNLETSPIAGEVPQRVLDELVNAKTVANDYAKAFGEVVKTQSEKYKVNPAALKRYVSALAGDNVEKLEAECEHLERLLHRD